MTISFYHILGIVLSIVLIEVVGILSSRKVKTADDFSRAGGMAGTWVVCGTIMGTLIGGQSTVGTAQLAFTYGISAWWFTLGSGIALIIMAIFYAVPLRRSSLTTVSEFLVNNYGKVAGPFTSISASGFSSIAVCNILTNVESSAIPFLIEKSPYDWSMTNILLTPVLPIFGVNIG